MNHDHRSIWGAKKGILAFGSWTVYKKKKKRHCAALSVCLSAANIASFFPRTLTSHDDVLASERESLCRPRESSRLHCRVDFSSHVDLWRDFSLRAEPHNQHSHNKLPISIFLSPYLNKSPAVVSLIQRKIDTLRLRPCSLPSHPFLPSSSFDLSQN